MIIEIKQHGFLGQDWHNKSTMNGDIISTVNALWSIKGRANVGKFGLHMLQNYFLEMTNQTVAETSSLRLISFSRTFGIRDLLMPGNQNLGTVAEPYPLNGEAVRKREN